MLTPLSRFLAEQPAPESLRQLILAVADACRDIGHAVNTSAIEGLTGALEQENVQGEMQKKLDVIANDMMLEARRWGGHVSALVSEEMEEIYPLISGEYLLVFDPIDGSSNVDVNGVVGTIFSVLKAPEGPIAEADVLQPGRRQLAAGYAIYGPQTTLVLTLGAGVSAFSLDQKTGDWLMTTPRMTIPASTREFAINMSNHRHWMPSVRRYIDECLAGKTGVRGADFNMRWLASMVGDVHRVLTRGGIFMYPVDSRKGIGKLRLMYEANPIAFLIEQAGGLATDGVNPILDIQPDDLHQRVGVVLGSREEVERVADYHKA
ncbi:class 1 fructose-bisphosphatase [Asticcacaulis taihuensis]|uniref:Fructose-1,6-bisphosphatase class 1 n=1 Tax=Asticcacaulis taihuensis TaxID=260084 RepID=A0A1G4SCB4_9CAUL|nr:class 1 fructose-bisphosphatase [Asticcacaulis taihuensis]SCW66706.1 fructose-1,6-bisphosphatase I [Asticcacaulis taihuensis]